MPDFLGKNDLPAREMFLQRNIYNGYALAELVNVSGPQLETIQIKDFAKDEKLLIGRVDLLGNPILINTDFLDTYVVAVGGSNKPAINFVIAAFKAMKTQFDRDLRYGVISSDSVALGELDIKKAYVDPQKSYLDFQEEKKNEFMDFVKFHRRIKDIKDFSTFMDVYMDFVGLTTPESVITQTMHILTKSNSVLSSGLAIEIYEADYDNDRLKIDLFYNDPNFEYLKNLAYSHGFVIDKHIPWRLVADLNSPQMAPYIESSLGLPGAKAGSVLALMYNKPHVDDLSDLANMMIDTYNMIVDYRPRTVIKKPSATASTSAATTVFGRCKRRTTIRRRRASATDAALLPLSYWVDKYVRIRNAETGLGYGEASLNTIVKNSTDLMNSLDSSIALGYIVSKFDNVSHFEGSLFYDITRFEMREDPSATGESVLEKVQRSVQASNFVQY